MQRAGPWPVQLRHETTLTSEDYVSRKAWLQARLKACPLHGSSCGFQKHGTYVRVKPPGMRVARLYCRVGRMTFSLLPDCLAARLPGSLDEVEQAVVSTESAGVSAVAASLRVDEVELPAALRWLYRRRHGVHVAALALVTALPTRLGPAPELRAIRSFLGTDRALVALRGIGADHLHALPAPIGFQPHVSERAQRERARQHETGTDPPTR